MRSSIGILTGLALLAVTPAMAADGGVAGTPAAVPDAGLMPVSTTGLVKPGTATAPGQQKDKTKKAAGDDTTTPAEETAVAAQPDAVVPAGEPVMGQRVAVAPEGAVRVRLPGGEWTALDAGGSVPNGTMVDTRAGSITLTTAADAAGGTQSASFGGATFTVDQASASSPVTDLKLRGGDFAHCPSSTAHVRGPWAAFAAKARRPVRQLFGSGHGKFRTHGRNASATVRGTVWVTEDFCDRTVVTVRRGLVAVRDLHTGRSFSVPAGSSKTIRRR